MANTYKLSRGAVEAASTGGAGNEYKAWRGAVEPIGEAAPTTSAVRIGVGRLGGYAVESQISGFAGFKIQRPKDRPAPAKKP